MQATMIQRELFDESEPCERLTPEQQAMAAKYRHYALKLANRWHSCCGGDKSEWQAEALLGLCLAALKFDATRMSRWNEGPAAFVSCIWHQVRSKLSEFRRRRGQCGLRQVPRDREVRRELVNIPDGGAKDQRLELIEKQEAARLAMAFLKKRERCIVVERIDHGRNLAVVAKRVGICRERVRQIQDQAIDKMRTALVSRGVQYA